MRRFRPSRVLDRLRSKPARAVALALGMALSTTSCQSADNAPLPSVPVATPDLIREVREALNFLPPLDTESFKEFLPRARAAMLLAESESVRAAARNIPEDPLLFVGSSSNQFFPVILAEWAMRRARGRRVAVLQALVSLRTDGRHLDPTRPGARRRKNGTPYPTDPRRFGATLQSQALSMGLRYNLHDDRIVEIGQIAGRGKVPKITLGTVLLARADTLPLTTEEGWTTPPFAGTYDGERVIGRGALLDKGPLVAALFALDAVIDSGVPFARPPHLLVDLATSEGGEAARRALHPPNRKSTTTPLLADEDALDKFFRERGRPARLFALDSHLYSEGGSTGLLRLELISAPTEFSTREQSRYRLVAVDAEAAPGATPGTATAVWLLPDGDVPDPVAQIQAALGERAHGARWTRDKRAVTAKVQSPPGAGYATQGPRGATVVIADVLDGMQAAGLLHEDACSTMLMKLQAAPSLAQEQPSSISLGEVTTDDDGRCHLATEVRWVGPSTAEAILDALAAALGPNVTATVVTRLPPHQTTPPPAALLAAKEALGAYTEVPRSTEAPFALAGTRDVLIRQTLRGVGLGPLPNLTTARADAPNESIGVNELDELVAIYAYALAKAGR